MFAVDTNFIVHFLVDDDRSQTQRAQALIESENIFVGTTVLLETEWVLRSVYDLSSDAISAAIRSFCGLPRIMLENEPLVTQALGWMDGGLDFADALHLATCPDSEAFLTFDKSLVRRARRLRAGHAKLA